MYAILLTVAGFSKLRSGVKDNFSDCVLTMRTIKYLMKHSLSYRSRPLAIILALELLISKTVILIRAVAILYKKATIQSFKIFLIILLALIWLYLIVSLPLIEKCDSITGSKFRFLWKRKLAMILTLP